MESTSWRDDFECEACKNWDDSRGIPITCADLQEYLRFQGFDKGAEVTHECYLDGKDHIPATRAVLPDSEIRLLPKGYRRA